MGKTQLARKSAEDLASQFPDGTYLLELDGMTEPKTSVAVMKELIAKCIPGTGLLPEAMAELQPMYLAALGTKKLLLVFDNADDAGQVSPLLKDLPKSVGVIITSRKLISLPYVKRIDLEVMSSMDAVTLLNGIVTQTRSDLSEDDLKAIAVLCGHLPLALRVAGTMLRDDKKWTQKRFAKALQDDPLHHLTLGADEYNVGAILRLSVQQLVLLNAEQAERFQMLSVFPGTFAEDAAATVWNLDEDETFTDLDELQNRSLIEWDEKTTRYRLHDLMRPVARDAFPSGHTLQAGGDERIALAERRHAEHYAEVLIRAGKARLLEGLQIFDVEVVNITACRTWAASRWKHNLRSAELYRVYALAGFGFYRYRTTPQSRLEIYQLCINACMRINDHSGESGARVNMGETLVMLGDDERAILQFEISVGISEKIDDNLSKAVARGKIADIYHRRGQIVEALHIRCKEELPVYELLGEVREKAVLMGKIADVFQASEQFEIALRIRREEELVAYEQLGDVLEKAVTLGKIAQIFQTSGNIDESLRMYSEEVLPVFERLGDVREAAVIKGRIADSLWAIGRMEEALCIRDEEELPVYNQLGDIYMQVCCRAIIGYMLMLNPKRTVCEFKKAREHLLWALATAENHQYAEAAEIREIVTQWFGGSV